MLQNFHLLVLEKISLRAVVGIGPEPVSLGRRSRSDQTIRQAITHRSEQWLRRRSFFRLRFSAESSVLPLQAARKECRGLAAALAGQRAALAERSAAWAVSAPQALWLDRPVQAWVAGFVLLRAVPRAVPAGRHSVAARYSAAAR